MNMYDAIHEAARDVAALSVEVWAEMGEHFTCEESDALVALFDALGLEDHARSLEQYHAQGDHEGDDHYSPPLDLPEATVTCSLCGAIRKVFYVEGERKIEWTNPFDLDRTLACRQFGHDFPDEADES